MIAEVRCDLLFYGSDFEVCKRQIAGTPNKPAWAGGQLNVDHTVFETQTTEFRREAQEGISVDSALPTASATI